MKGFLFFILVTLQICERIRALSQIKDCISDNPGKYVYLNLPGNGWDNLMNEDRKHIVKFDYSTCKISNDGIYLVPDNVVVDHLKSSKVDLFSEIIDHWGNYTDVTSRSINNGGNVGIPWIFSVHGSYSAEYQEVKKNQVNDDSMTVRVEARYENYISKLQSHIPLDEGFKEQILVIANHLLSERKHSARYESQMLIRDYGTHVVTTVTAGAAIYKLDQINRTTTQNSDITRSQITKSAGISLFGSGIEFDHDSSTTKTTVQQYLSLQTHSSVRTHGGPSFKPVNFSINQWVDGIDNDIVAIDRNGDPINFLVNQKNFPELPLSIVEQVATEIQDAIVTYYKYNTIKGCTNVNSPNFNFVANVDDGSCYEAGVNLTLGGVYQTCDYQGDLSENLCDGLSTVNPKTGSITCPEGYSSVPLVNGNISKVETTQECSSYLIFWKKCHSVQSYGLASYQTFWCAAVKDKVPDNSGYLFGGLFTSISTNPVTNSHACPPSFKPFVITSDVSLCLSDDYENGERFSIQFGGLYSCQNGNPLANNFFTPSLTSKTCPAGYSQNLATIEDGCEILYCAKLKSPATGTVHVRSPPFIKQRLERHDNTSYIISNEGKSWTNIYSVPENFSGFPDDIKEWITDNGNDLNVRSLLNDRDEPTGVQGQPVISDQAQPNRSKRGHKYRSMSTIEMTILISVTTVTTLIFIMVALLLGLKIVKSKNKKTE